MTTLSSRRVLAGPVVLLAVLYGLSGCSGSGSGSSAESESTTTLGAADAPVPPGLAKGCPPPSTRLRLPDGDLRRGVVGVRLCPGAPVVGDDGMVLVEPIQPPVDELVSAGDDLVDLVNSLPSLDPSRGCPLDLGPSLVYWLRYGDGEARAVSYGAYGCHSLVAGVHAETYGGERLALAFSDALFAQRSSQRAAVRHPRPTCDFRERSLTALPMTDVQLATATLCVRAGPHPVPGCEALFRAGQGAECRAAAGPAGEAGPL
ncbi:MAG: hypothetical protein H0X12_15605 [Nocardioides sp.]|nr:hypothetical protein [Nocardioides sp.]